MNGPTVDLPIGTRNWTALETLAEVSRQIDLSEKHDDRSVNNRSAGGGSRASEPLRSDRLELQEQYTLDNPPVSYEQRVQRDKKSKHFILYSDSLLTIVSAQPKGNTPRK
jgi:hypothetical protein